MSGFALLLEAKGEEAGTLLLEIKDEGSVSFLPPLSLFSPEYPIMFERGYRVFPSQRRRSEWEAKKKKER